MASSVCIVAPFHGRFDISGLVLDQWSQLRDNGHIFDAVIVACDENIDLALDRGFTVSFCSNFFMGERWNMGFRTAEALGAGHVLYVGSDNWVHPDACFPTPFNRPVSGHKIDFVDVGRGVLQHAELRDFYGAIPWLIPMELIQPLPPTMQLGSETMLAHAMGRPNFIHRKEPFAPCVDFKTKESRSPYAGVANSIGDGIEHDAVEALAEHWPDDLVQKAKVVMDGRVRNAC